MSPLPVLVFLLAPPGVPGCRLADARVERLLAATARVAGGAESNRGVARGAEAQ